MGITLKKSQWQISQEIHRQGQTELDISSKGQCLKYIFHLIICLEPFNKELFLPLINQISPFIKYIFLISTINLKIKFKIVRKIDSLYKGNIFVRNKFICFRILFLQNSIRFIYVWGKTYLWVFYFQKCCKSYNSLLIAYFFCFEKLMQKILN